MAHTRQYPSAFPIAPLSASQPLGTGVGQRCYAGLGMPPFRRRRQWPAERLPLATLVPMDSRSGYRACAPIAVFTSLPNSPFPSLPTRIDDFPSLLSYWSPRLLLLRTRYNGRGKACITIVERRLCSAHNAIKETKRLPVSACSLILFHHKWGSPRRPVQPLHTKIPSPMRGAH